MKLPYRTALLAVVLSSAITVTSTITEAAPLHSSGPVGQYLSAQLAIAHVDSYSDLSDGLAFVGTYGIAVPALHPYFGVEGEFTKSLIHPDYHRGTEHAEFDYFTLAGYAVFTVPLNDKFSVRGRGGMLYENWEYSINGGGRRDAGSEVGLSLGGGALYNFQPDMNLVADMTIIEGDIVHFSAGAQFKF